MSEGFEWKKEQMPLAIVFRTKALYVDLKRCLVRAGLHRFPTTSFNDKDNSVVVGKGTITEIAHYHIDVRDSSLSDEHTFSICGAHIKTVNGKVLREEDLNRALDLISVA